MQLKFSLEQIPRKVWWFKDLPNGVAPGELTTSNALVPDSLGYVYAEADLLSDPKFMLMSGIAWQW